MSRSTERGSTPTRRRTRGSLTLFAPIIACVVVAGCSSGGGTQPAAGTSSTTTTGTGMSPTSSSSAASLHDQLPPAIQQKGELTVGTTAEFPPCEFFPTGQTTMTGFEPDLWNAIGAKLGVQVKATSLQFSSLLPGVQTGKFDLAMECIRDTADREKTVAMVDFVYGAPGFLFLADNSHHISGDALSVCGLTGAIVTGSANEDRLKTVSTNCASHGKPAVKPVQFPAQANVLLALKSKRADFTIQDLAAARYITQTSDVKMTAVATPLIPKGYLGIVVNKSNAQLQQAVLAALKAVVADGTYDKIMAKWGISELGLSDPGINLASTRPIGS